MALRGVAGMARLVGARRGAARRGKVRLARFGLVWPGRSRHVRARPGGLAMMKYVFKWGIITGVAVQCQKILGSIANMTLMS